jgi:hypothetical protein
MHFPFYTENTFIRKQKIPSQYIVRHLFHNQLFTYYDKIFIRFYDGGVLLSNERHSVKNKHGETDTPTGCKNALQKNAPQTMPSVVVKRFFSDGRNSGIGIC